MRNKLIGFIISVVCFIISLGFVKGQAMALPFVPTDWTWEMYQGLHMLGDLIANDVNFGIPDWVDFNDFDDVKLFLENIYNEGKKKVAYASIIADLCVGTWENFLVTGEVDLGFSEQNIKRVHNTGFFQHVVDTIHSVIPEPGVDYLSYIDTINGSDFWFKDLPQVHQAGNGYPYNISAITYPFSNYSWFGSIGSYYEFAPSPITSIYVNSVNGVYSFSIDCTSVFPVASLWGDDFSSFKFKKSLNDWVPTYGEGAEIKHYDSSGTLDTVLNFISLHFRNVNIYVDGAPWALVGGGAIDNPLGVVIPDNTIDDIQVGDTKGHIISATLPDTDNYVGSIDLGVVMDELREAQAEGRQASLEKVKTKEGVKAIDGTVVDTKTKAVAIDVPVVSSVVASADDFGYIPYYPEIPSAFSGTTILSELIDATQNIIPNELIMAIWGLVIILFIIALIKIFYR